MPVNKWARDISKQFFNAWPIEHSGNERVRHGPGRFRNAIGLRFESSMRGNGCCKHRLQKSWTVAHRAYAAMYRTARDSINARLIQHGEHGSKSNVWTNPRRQWHRYNAHGRGVNDRSIRFWIRVCALRNTSSNHPRLVSRRTPRRQSAATRKK